MQIDALKQLTQAYPNAYYIHPFRMTKTVEGVLRFMDRYRAMGLLDR